MIWCSLTIYASVAPKGDIEVLEADEVDLQLTVAYDKEIVETDEAAMFVRICKESQNNNTTAAAMGFFYIYLLPYWSGNDHKFR